jgi:NAD(P)H-dependent FMN reductase
VHVFLIVASHRTASLNRLLAGEAARLLEAGGCTVEAPDYAALDLPLFNAQQAEEGIIPPACYALAKRLAAADALVIASPEYNWSYPGSLKNLLDWMSHIIPCSLAGRTALLMSASPSLRGGVMGLTQLKTPLDALGMHVYPALFLLSGANQAFTEQGALAEAAQKERLARLTREFVAYTVALRGKGA